MKKGHQWLFKGEVGDKRSLKPFSYSSIGYAGNERSLGPVCVEKCSVALDGWRKYTLMSFAPSNTTAHHLNLL